MDDLTLVDRVQAKFSGERGGEGPLTLGQLNTLDWIGDNTRDYFGVSELVLTLPDETTIDDIAEAFGILLARHESLRTSFIIDGDPRQKVVQSGALPIDVYAIPEHVTDVTLDVGVPYAVDALAPNDASNPAAALLTTMRTTPFNLTDDLLIRVSIATRSGRPVAGAVVCSHMIADVGAMMVIGRQFTELVSDPANREVGPATHQPLDQAEAERSERGRRQAEATLRYWENNLRWMPHSMFGIPPDEPGPGGPMSGWLHSPALALALPHVVARTGASAPMAITAALSAVLAHRTGNRTSIFRFISNNRVGRRLHDYVGTIAQESLLVVETDADTFDELSRRCGTASFKAGMYGAFETSRLIALAKSLEHERGIRFHRDAVLNNLTTYLIAGAVPDSARTPSSSPADAAAALPQTNIAWWEPTTFNSVLVEFQVVQTGSWISLGLWTGDTRLIPKTEIEALLRGVDRLLVAAAAADVALDRLTEITGLSPVRRGPDWLHIDACWIELSQTQKLLEDALGATRCRVFALAEPAGRHRLVAYLVPGPTVRTPQQAHAACMATLTSRFTAMAPAHYVICERAPDDPSDLSAWQRQPVLAQGDGRTTGLPAPGLDGHNYGDHRG